MRLSRHVCIGVATAIVIAVASIGFGPSGSRAEDQAQEKTEVATEVKTPEKAEDPKKLTETLIGTWRLEEAKSPGLPSGVGCRLKFFTGTHWTVTQPDPTTGEVVFHHGGTYSVDGNTVKTTTDFAGESTKGRIGTAGSFTIKVDGDTLIQVDSNGVFDETWKRVK